MFGDSMEPPAEQEDQKPYYMAITILAWKSNFSNRIFISVATIAVRSVGHSYPSLTINVLQVSPDICRYMDRIANFKLTCFVLDISLVLSDLKHSRPRFLPSVCSRPSVELHRSAPGA